MNNDSAVPAPHQLNSTQVEIGECCYSATFGPDRSLGHSTVPLFAVAAGAYIPSFPSSLSLSLSVRPRSRASSLSIPICRLNAMHALGKLHARWIAASVISKLPLF